MTGVKHQTQTCPVVNQIHNEGQLLPLQYRNSGQSDRREHLHGEVKRHASPMQER